MPLQRARIDRYLREAAEPRLHLGAGRNILAGWLNTDYLGCYPRCLHLDARRRFPFASLSFSYIFSEHMIEHLSFDEGIHVLGECYRVLGPGGVIRIETPDLRFVAGLYAEPPDEERRAYLKFHAEVFKGPSVPASPCIAINNIMRHWGHQFLYDEETLRPVLLRAGFGGVTRVRTGSSEHRPLDGLTSRDWLPTNEIETLAVEARK